MWVSDILVLSSALVLLLLEAKGTTTQGCAYPLIRLFIGGSRRSTALGGVSIVDDASTREESSNAALPGVPAFADASPAYSKRWLLADALVAGVVALFQVWLIGLL